MRLALPLLAVLSLGFAPAPAVKPHLDPGKKDLERLQGEWLLVSRVRGGWPVREVGVSMVITRSQGQYLYGKPRDASPWIAMEHSRGEGFRWNLTLDAKATPRGFTVSHSLRGVSDWHGIYKLDGDTLTICHTHMQRARPRTFEAPTESDILEVFKRKRP